MLTQVLKDKMGFDGVVISDWNGHSEISGCSMGDCEAAVLAGIDIFMVTARKDWDVISHQLTR
nr:putative glucan 1,4-beta-glucosidase [Raoultella sp. NCTC 9187]